MKKTRIVVDTPSDIPDRYLSRYDIDMVGVPISIDGKQYIERQSFSIQEFYPLLEDAQELPKTSRVPIGSFTAAYTRAWEEGCSAVIVVTMNSGGSGTYESAQMAAELFFADHPAAADSLCIHLIDSGTYSMAYGYPVSRAASMAQKGMPAEEILSYLDDFFSRAEIYLVCYSLEYAKKSGRISAAAAFLGDVLGMRPVISMIDGTTKIVEKVRGNKNATRRLAEIYRQKRLSPHDTVVTVSAAEDEYGMDLKTQLEQELGRKVPHYKAGAAVTINSGPKMAALCLLGDKRKKGGHWRAIPCRNGCGI